VSVVALDVPARLRDAAIDEGRTWWLDELAELMVTVQDRWSLTLGPPLLPGGQAAWVAPVVGGTATGWVVKIGGRHAEAEHEAEGLDVWDGGGTVRLLRAERHEHTIVLLLERCSPGRPLSDRPEPEQDLVIAGLLRRLWLPPADGWGFRPLQEMCHEWAAEFERAYAEQRRVLDAGMARDGVALLRSLPVTAPGRALLCTDLHAGNVLSAQREPWLVIDPKPYVGDPHFDVLQHLLNCDERLLADPRTLARRMTDLLDLDLDRVMLWLFARCVQESLTSPVLGELARRIAPA